MKERRRRPLRRRNIQKKKVRWGRLAAAVMILAALLGGLIFGAWKGFQAISGYFPALTMQTSAPAQEPARMDTPKLALEQKSLDQPAYILIVGRDNSSPAQADSLFLAAVNMDQKSVDLIGIPANSKIESRDRKSIQPLSAIYDGGNINLTKAVVEDIFHITIPYYVIIDEAAFAKTIDAAGSQDIYVERNMQHTDAATGKEDINLHQGYQTLDGAKAVAYTRFIDEDGNDFARLQRQERLIKQVFSRQSDMFTLSKIWMTWRIWGDYDSNISTADAVRMVFRLRGMTNENVHYYILPGVQETVDGKVYWNIDPTEAQRLVGITLGSEGVAARS